MSHWLQVIAYSTELRNFLTRPERKKAQPKHVGRFERNFTTAEFSGVEFAKMGVTEPQTAELSGVEKSKPEMI